MREYDDAHGLRAWIDPSADDSVTSYLREIGRIAPLSEGEAAELIERVTSGDQEALQRLTESQLRLVVIAAKDYVHRELDLIDLFQAGNMGLVRAVANISKIPPGMTVREFAMVNIRRSIEERLTDA